MRIDGFTGCILVIIACLITSAIITVGSPDDDCNLAKGRANAKFIRQLHGLEYRPDEACHFNVIFTGMDFQFDAIDWTILPK